MRLKIGRYDHYSNSEIDGLAEIPSHWRLERLKSISEIRSGVAKGRNLSGKKTIELPYLRVANVQENRLELDDISMIEIQLSEESRYSLKPGDVLMTEGGDNDKLGRGAVWKGQIPRCLHQNHIFAVRPFDPENSYWINWMTQTEFLKYFFLSRSKQTTNLASISSTNLKVTPIVFPSLYERSAIATYLDTKTAQIDRKIDLLTQKAQRYEELKRSLINETVTGRRRIDNGKLRIDNEKGENCQLSTVNYPLYKDSGIEWIGKIPEHWNVKRVKEIFTIGRGRVIAQTELIEDGIYPVYSSQTKDDGCLGHINTFDFEGEYITWTTDGVNAGTVFLRQGKFNCTNICGTLQLKSRKHLLRYLHYFLQVVTRHNKRIDTNGAKIMNNEMAFIKIALPPYKEQIKIADYLDIKTAHIHQIIQTINTQIEKQKELRKTLINDVVTGKIKVIEN